MMMHLGGVFVNWITDEFTARAAEVVDDIDVDCGGC